jgi:uncharacterized membrane protein YgdD (TMEM256/DUF423 family)
MNWIVVGAIWGFLAVAFGAFGAHGLRTRVSEQAIAWWNTGAHYQLTHALAIVLVGLLRLHAGRGDAAGWAFLLGSFVFSATLYAMALGAPRWLGAITPIGGLGLLAGWILLALAARGLR